MHQQLVAAIQDLLLQHTGHRPQAQHINQLSGQDVPVG
jgi:hypothetical protein